MINIKDRTETKKVRHMTVYTLSEKGIIVFNQ